MGNKIVEFIKKYQDQILVSLFFGVIMGIAFTGGAFLVRTLTWTAISFIVGGLFFGLGNEMFHSIKRTILDKVWPFIWDKALKPLIDFIKGVFGA